ncbi:MAG: hypothetical protein CK429_34900 [Mycobacterium sp.]|uniref:hypothetical protein n=1 Tax=Mycobacterium sp. TaxID=1785 RepID=UPI000CB0B619|nr:hypothetical protein [Mycobacterium sp.]PJE02179.1 MAG: hypothetical protein CK429_34900 [Mycobacterium sp.]PJE05673.1 MAG: hypothetical protein CK428_25900 [Mycobacterium sp.]PJE24340.1 MAG: hypothetical protein CK431_06425 [Mycobacterium sp.]
MGAKTARPNREQPVALDVEGGAIGARDIKAAREVAEDAMTERSFQRLANQFVDELRDDDSSLTRAARDRDRATPRDVSHVDSDRLRGELPAREEFREILSGRQRKIRSTVKNRVMAAAPASQHAAINSLLSSKDPTEWRRVNERLHLAAGDAQQLTDGERAKVQRLDRAIQSYERLNDRTHRVYVAVRLPDNHADITKPSDLPASLQPGASVAFDQFTLTRHNLHETPGHDSSRYVVFEVVTSRGMYLGRSDSVEDTTHVLPRGMQFDVASAEHVAYATRPRGFNERLVLQLRER